MWRIRTSSGAVHNLFLLITVCCWFAHILLATPDAPFAADKIFVFIWLFTSKNIVINDKIRATFSQEHFKNIASKEQIITKGKATYFNKSLLAETVGFEPTVPVKVQLISSVLLRTHFSGFWSKMPHFKGKCSCPQKCAFFSASAASDSSKCERTIGEN